MTLHQVIVKDVQVQLNTQLQLNINAQKRTKYDFCFELIIRFSLFSFLLVSHAR